VTAGFVHRLVRNGALRPVAAAVVVAALSLSGCGKKGPPLAPIVRVPAPVADLAARRLGDSVHIGFTVPAANRDGSKPAEIDRVELYGYTALQAGDVRDLRDMTLVAAIPVASQAEAGAADVTAVGKQQGSTVTLSEVLSPGAFVAAVVEGNRRPEIVEGPVPPGLPLLWPPQVSPLRRFYVAQSVGNRRSRVSLSAAVAVLLTEAPPAPPPPTVTYTADRFAVAWEAGDGTTPDVEEAPAEPLLKGRPIFIRAASHAYNVYDVPRAADGTPRPAGAPLPAPLSAKPLSAPPYIDRRLEFGVERCYAVSAVRLFEEGPVEGPASEAACVIPLDVFPPAAPASLAAVGGEGAISLIWEPNTEPDLAGYLVLRAEAPDETLQALTTTPIRQTTYRDTAIRPGVRYVYAVVAVDTASPANVSAESNRVEESAR
jgi:predicted small lipoprotein YifL/fibronectin type 3 domain-containing protein